MHTVICECGWRKSFPASQGGITVQCEQCGLQHTVPAFPRDDHGIDMALMKNLLARDNPPRVHFKPLLLGALLFSVIVAALSFALVRPLVPHAVAVAGGALSWPVAIGVAWLGQLRQRARDARQEFPAQ